MLNSRQLFSITIIFFIIMSGCSSSNAVASTQIATLSIATETPEPSPSPTTIPSATAEPTPTPIPINVRESLELAQEISPDAEAIVFGYDDIAYARDKDRHVVSIYNPETKKWGPLPFSADELTKFSEAKFETSNVVILTEVRIGNVIDLGTVGNGAIEMGDGYFILQMFEAWFLNDNGQMEVVLIPSITQSKDGTVLYGMVAFANFPDPDVTLEKLKILAAESAIGLLFSSITADGYTPGDQIYKNLPSDVRVEPSERDTATIYMPRKDSYPSDLNRVEMSIPSPIMQ